MACSCGAYLATRDQKGMTQAWEEHMLSVLGLQSAARLTPSDRTFCLGP